MSIVNQISDPKDYSFKQSGDYVIFNSSLKLDEFLNIRFRDKTIKGIKFEIRYQVDSMHDKAYFMTDVEDDKLIIAKDDIGKTSYAVLKILMNAIFKQRLLQFKRDYHSLSFRSFNSSEDS